MEVKPGYKQTEVGVIPEDWDVKSLGEFGGFSKGGGIRKDEAQSGDLPCIRYGEIYTHHNDIVRKYNSRISAGVAKASKRLRNGDILFAGSGETKEEIGKAVAFISDDEAYAGGDIVILSPRDSSSAFLGYALNAPFVARQKASKGQGDAVVHIGANALASIKLPTPSFAEQSAIATALSDMDALLDGLDCLIAKKRAIKQAAMQQLLTGQTRLPGFSGAWEIKRLGDHLTFLKNGVNSRAELSYSEDVRYLHYGDIHGSSQVMLNPASVEMPCLPRAKASRLDRLQNGDLIFADASEDMDGIGKSVEIQNAVGIELVSGLHTIAIRFDKSVLADGFKAYIQFIPKFRAHLRQLAAGTKVYATNRAHIASTELRLPGIDEQQAISAVLTDMDAEITALESRHTKTRALKQAMMQELLTGRTRLVTPASEASGTVVSISAGKSNAKTKTHNWQINEAVVISVLAGRFGSEQYPLGRKRCTKLAYLMHRYVEHVAEGFRKKAAGPYNPDVKYRGPEGIAQKNGYIRQHRNGQFSGFIADQNIAVAEAYFMDWYGQEVLDWLEQFRKKTNDELELLATVDMSVEDLEKKGSVISLETVKALIAEHPEWKPKLERPIFSDINIKRAIQQARELFAEHG